MSDEQPKTRSLEREIEIDAPIEVVWKAITEAEEITRWFSEEARVTPGAGGSYWVSCGEGLMKNSASAGPDCFKGFFPFLNSPQERTRG